MYHYDVFLFFIKPACQKRKNNVEYNGKEKLRDKRENMIRICLCDDDPIWVDMMKTRIEKNVVNIDRDFEICVCSSLEKLEGVITTRKIDVLFLDIVLEDVNSADWLAENLEDSDVEVLFMTAFPEEAYSISEVDHAYFLVKSRITDEMIEKSLNRAKERIENKSESFGVFRVNGKKLSVNFADVLCFESDDNYVRIHLKDGTTLDSRTTMSNCSRKTPDCFLRCHRSFLINMNYVKEVRYSCFVLSNSTVVQIPPKKYAQTVEAYEKYIKSTV